jgi:hypothetical protein
MSPGVASDEMARHGWNEHKAARLVAAGAAGLAPDFTHMQELI